jgi:peptidoglycan/xylan/chitin deacetylase (PgdA/CDA1 family)
VTGKNAIIFIDTESGLEGPWREYLDFGEGISQISKVLHRYKVTAVFNTCGKLLELHPRLFVELEKQGHEIALHGWKHENLRMLDDQWLEKVLARSHQAYSQTLGHSPYGFRAPWLDYDQRLLEWLNRKGYLWVSHRHLFFRERFFSPAARPEIRAGQRMAGLWASWQERNFPKVPYQIKQGLKELPLTSSMDGELLGLVSPLQPSPARDVDYAVNAWHQQLLRAPNFFTLNLHDWLISSGNRPDVLNKMISLLLSQNYKITTARQIT